MVSDNTSWTRLGGSTAIPHASALGIVAACLVIQVRIVHSCVSAIKINAKYYSHEMSGIKIQKIASKFLNTHFKDLLDNTEKEPAVSDTIDLLSSEEEEVDVKFNDEEETCSSSSSRSDDDETYILLSICFLLL
jgi:hypothetical protein